MSELLFAAARELVKAEVLVEKSREEKLGYDMGSALQQVVELRKARLVIEARALAAAEREAGRV